MNDDCLEAPCDPDIFKQCLPDKKYRILSSKKENIGYTKAFEYLVQSSKGKYVALCDQDDIGDQTKIEKCVCRMKKDHTLLVATDRKLINTEGHVYCDSVRHRQSRPWEQWHTYDDIGVKNFFATCAPGMCLMAEGDFVRQTVPFSTETGHDKWIIACAGKGKRKYVRNASRLED